MNIGKTIKLLRIMLGVKQRDLAKKIGVSPNYLSMIETDKREPSLSFIKNLSQELNVPVSFFFLESIEDMGDLSEKQKAAYHKIREILFEVQKIRVQKNDSKNLEEEKTNV